MAQAAKTIAGFKISTENYKTALNPLKERYENKHLLKRHK